MKDAKKMERLGKTVLSAQLAAARRVSGLFKAPNDPAYNPDAVVPWKDCSTMTRAALLLTQGTMAYERAKQQAEAPRVFGLVVMPARIDDPAAWERKHALETTATVASLPAVAGSKEGEKQ